MFELQILIPQADNDGKHFSAGDHLPFQTLLVDRCGGYTRHPGHAVGAWRNEAGVTFHDRNIVYGIALESIFDVAKLADVIEFAKSHYRQEAIYIRYLGVSEIK